MARVIRSGRINALLAVLVFGGIGLLAVDLASAQQPQTPAPTSLGGLFKTNIQDQTGAAELRPGSAEKLRDALKRANPSGGCSNEAKFKVLVPFVPGGDRLLAPALGAARRDVVEAVLNGQAGRFSVSYETGGRSNDVRVEYGPADREPPKLHTESTPRKGTKVKAGDRIEVRMIARDDANQWQSGVSAIELVAEESGRVYREEYPRPSPPCGSNPVPALTVIYTVPSNPPPIVRLTATTWDFAGHKDTDIGEFPTRDWHGTIKKQANGGGHNHTIDVDFAFEIETSGAIKGRAFARITTAGGEVPGCTLLWTYSPREFDIPLSGRRNGEDFEIALEPGTTTATVKSIAGGCASGGGQTSNTFPAHLNPAVYAETKYRISAQDGATNTVERSAGALPWGVTMRDTITIRQTRQ